MAIDTNTGFSSRGVAFFGLPSSRIIPREVRSSEEAIRLAGLDWTVEKVPAFDRKANGDFEAVPGMFHARRADTQQVFGPVGNVWAPLQNAEAFAATDAALEYGAEYVCGLSWNGGADVLLSAKLPEGFKVAGEDAHDLYWLFRNNHAGKGGVSVMITPIRLACTNMLPLALRSKKAIVTLRHTQSISARFEMIGDLLNLTSEYVSEFAETAETLAETAMTLEGFEHFVKDLTPAERIQRGMVETFVTSPSVTPTRWGALNAVSEYSEHLRGGRGNAETRFASNLDGQTANLRNRALRLLTTH